MINCFIFAEGTNSYSHLILLVDPPSGRSEKDEVIHNNYAAVPIVVAENTSSKQSFIHISFFLLSVSECTKDCFRPLLDS